MPSAANFRKQTLRALIIPPLLFGILSAVFLGLVVDLLFMLEWVGQADHLIARSNATFGTLVDREAALRGFLVSGSPRSLRVYREAEARLEGSFDHLARLTSRDIELSTRLARLRGQSELWGRDADEQIVLRVGAPGSGRPPDAAGGESRTTGEARATEVRNSMMALLDAEAVYRDRRSNSGQSRSWAILAAFSGAALFVGAAFVTTSRRRLVMLYGSVGAALDGLQARFDRQELENLSLLAEAMRYFAIFRLDPDGRILSWNSESERILGYRADEILGRRPSCFYNPDDIKRDLLYHDLEWASLEGRLEDERLLIRQDGFRFKARVALVAIRETNGALRGYTNVIHEIEDL